MLPFVYPGRADFRASKRNLRKRRKEETTCLESPPSFCVRTFLRLVLSARLSQQVHPLCRAPFPPTSSSSFLPFLPVDTFERIVSREGTVPRPSPRPPFSRFSRFNRSTEARSALGKGKDDEVNFRGNFQSQMIHNSVS